jgi:uncharacterized protein YjbI with pentapeptide repeats
MANKKHIATLKRGARAWNRWRSTTKSVPNLVEANLFGARLSGANLRRVRLRNALLGRADLTHADFSGANLEGAELSDTYLQGANFRDCDLRFVSFVGANLENADLSGAMLNSADFFHANLKGANLTSADLGHSLLIESNLAGADLSNAALWYTVFSDLDLSKADGLDRCRHIRASIIDYGTLQKSGQLPLKFLRGVGLPENLIEYLPSLLCVPIQHYSCFISYSTSDQGFTDRLHADLQDGGVRCWFAPHDMPIGGKIWDEIDSAIRLRDKVLLILSEHSIKSDWVEDEVTKAFEEERKRGQIVLFPIRLDDAVMDTNEAWAAKLRARHIGDFRRWKEHDEYQKSFARVLRDLTVKKDAP